MAPSSEPLVSDSNWILCYVVICLIPVVFICVASYSVWRDRRERATYDVAAFKNTYEKHWASTQESHLAQQFSRAAKPKFYIPTLPVNRVGPCTPEGFPVPAASNVSGYGGRLMEKRPL